MSKHQPCLLLTSTLCLMACSANIPQPQVVERHGLDSISTSATSSTAYIKTSGDSDRFCEGRGVDAVATSSSGFSLSGTVAPGENAGIGESDSSGALGLGGRDPTVLLARELLYRACELSLNLNLGLDDSKEIYYRFLQTIETVSGNQLNDGTSVQGFQEETSMTPSGQ